MPDDRLTPPDAASLERGAFRYFPVVPGRMEFACAVREALLRDRPRVVAVELPAALERAYLDAAARLPEMSVILYRDEGDEDDSAVYVPVEPADPFTEAVRTAREIGAEVVLIDALNGERPHLPGVYPDTYALRFIGLE